jgi:outer membrane protein
MQLRKSVILIATVMVVMLMGIPDGFCADVAKIGTISFQKIVENSIAGKAAKKEITDEGQRMEAELKKNGEEIKALQDQLEKDASVMSKEARDEKKWQVERKIDDVKALKQKYDRRLQDTQLRLVNKIRKEVFDIIQAFGKKEGYLLIIEDAGVVYQPESLDITDQIVQLYNEKQPKTK